MKNTRINGWRKQKKSRKKAIFFTLDAMLATGIIFIGFMLMPGLDLNKQTTTHLSYMSQDFLNVLSELKIYEMNSTYIDYLVTSGKITRINNTLLEQIGQFWAENDTEIGWNFTREVTEGIIPQGYGYGVWIGNEEIYSRASRNSTSILSSRKLVSGYAKYLPVFGYTSRAYLSSIKSRRASAVSYFGGFIGEGNITSRLLLSQNVDNVTGMMIEAVVGTDFKLYINNQFAGSFPFGSGNGSQIEPDIFTIDNTYLSYLKAGVNNITMKFTYIDENFTGNGPKYIGGGYIKATYTTSDTTDPDVIYLASNLASKRYWFNGIDGFINIYSSIYVPGNLTKMTVYLNLNSTYMTYLKIGNTTVYKNNTNGAAKITLTDSYLSSAFSSNGTTYSFLSSQTIPIRLALDNVTRTSSPLDAVLITDASGSMDDKMDESSGSSTVRACSDPNLNLMTTQKLSVAKCADTDFVNTILANSGPLLGLAAYSTDIDNYHNMSNNSASLNTQIGSYNVSGSTCICCGINTAVSLLMNDTQITVITRKSTGWKYNDTNLGSDPANWKNKTFADGGWKTGQAALGNGYAGLNTVIAKYQGYYYFRKKFNITNVSQYASANLNVYSDSGADVYLNGNLIDNDINSKHNAAYWNRDVYVAPSNLVEGENIIAVKLRNQKNGGVTRNPAFDLELVVSSRPNITASKKKVMLLMTDGAANIECDEQGNSGDLNYDGSSDTAKDDAIKASCDAYTRYGIITYAVGFGISADNSTLQYMANCTGGQYFSSTNYNQLRDTYLIIANSLIQFTETQEVNSSGITPTKIFPDSYIEFNYTPDVSSPVYGEIPVYGETDPFGNSISQGTLSLPAGDTLVELTATSYSADKWTDKVVTSSASKGTNLIYNLSRFGNNYHYLGDAFNINIPVSKIGIGENNIVTISTGTSPQNGTGGSSFDKMQYTVRINSLLGYGSVYSKKDGCSWFLEFYDGTNETLKVPSTYSGSKNCTFSSHVFDPNDALDNSAYSLFSKLDFDLDGKLEIKLDTNNLNIDSMTVSGVPSLWGPAVVEVRLW